MSPRTLLIWSSFAFLLPLGFALYFRVWPSAVLLVAVIITSLAYHRSEEKKFRHIDATFAWFLIVSNLWLCYAGNFVFPYFGIALAFAVAALYCYFYEQRRNYSVGHSLWHIFSALITIFSILTLLAGNGL